MLKYKKNNNKQKKNSNINIKFYYRPDWWNFKYIRWNVIGKRKFTTQFKKNKWLNKTERALNKKKTLFLYKKLSKIFNLNLGRSQLAKSFNTQAVRSPITKKAINSSLVYFVLNFYCILSLQQSKFIISKGWIFVNGKKIRDIRYKLKSADIVTILPFIWNRIAVWFKRFHFRVWNKKSYKFRKNKTNKLISRYKTSYSVLNFRKINSIAFIK